MRKMDEDGMVHLHFPVMWYEKDVKTGRKWGTPRNSLLKTTTFCRWGPMLKTTKCIGDLRAGTGAWAPIIHFEEC